MLKKLKQTHLAKTKPKPKPTLIFKNCSCVCVSLCTTVVHNTAQNTSDNLLSYQVTLRTVTVAQMLFAGGGGAHCNISLSLV